MFITQYVFIVIVIFILLLVLCTCGSTSVGSAAQCHVVRPYSSRPLILPSFLNILAVCLSLLPMLNLLLSRVQLGQLPLTRTKFPVKSRPFWLAWVPWTWLCALFSNISVEGKQTCKINMLTNPLS